MAKLTPQQALAKISDWLADLYGPRLQSLIVYGSLAGGGSGHGRHSDINLLAVLDCLDAPTLELGAPAVRWFTDLGHPPPVLLSRDEQDAAADVFPIEYLDIQANHLLLRGEDLFAQTPRFPHLHRLQVERELRAKLIQLRAGYMRLGDRAKPLEKLLLESASTFLVLFRHALVAAGQPLLLPKDQVAAAAAAHFGFSPDPFTAILAARRGGGRLAEGRIEALRPLFAQYLAAIQTVERALESLEESHVR